MAKQVTNTTNTSNQNYVFGKQNYTLLLAGIALILIGFMLMIGGGSEDPTVFSEAIFDTQRLTVAPIVVLSGFTVIIFAIIKKQKAVEK
ncbi:MAG: DUF3098 domain-containing protein [Bacteroidetes bacterium]|nr:DUF3098 domain-containing protein [Bacteroidota bacterium]